MVVVSVHSKLRMPAPADPADGSRPRPQPAVDVLGHCTGRLVDRRGSGRSRRSTRTRVRRLRGAGTAVEINSRPERLDPPLRLITLARDAGTLFAIDTDAHAPGQLDWQTLGCDRAEEPGIPAERIVTTWTPTAS